VDLGRGESLARLSLQIGFFLTSRVIIDLGDREEVTEDGLSREDGWKGYHESVEKGQNLRVCGRLLRKVWERVREDVLLKGGGYDTGTGEHKVLK
jgi:hypothetical protein